MTLEFVCVNTLAFDLKYFHHGMKYSSQWLQWSQNTISHFTEGISQSPVKSTETPAQTSVVTELWLL